MVGERRRRVDKVSRSVKRVGCVKGGSYGAYGKRMCNRKVRRAGGLFQNAEYRKVGSSLDIWDYKFFARASDKGDYRTKKVYFAK